MSHPARPRVITFDEDHPGVAPQRNDVARLLRERDEARGAANARSEMIEQITLERDGWLQEAQRLQSQISNQSGSRLMIYMAWWLFGALVSAVLIGISYTVRAGKFQ